MGRIVAGVDGSEGSRTALRFAIAQARLGGHEVVAIHAFPPPTATHPYAYWGEAYLPTGQFDRLRERAEQQLGTAVDEVAGDVTDVKVLREVVAGSPAQILVEFAEGAEMLVVGTRGHGTFRELMLGSVSHKVATHAPCPVVIVPPER